MVCLRVQWPNISSTLDTAVPVLDLETIDGRLKPIPDYTFTLVDNKLTLDIPALRVLPVYEEQPAVARLKAAALDYSEIESVSFHYGTPLKVASTGGEFEDGKPTVCSH